jgi:Tfp pilus assembly protein PilV
MKNNKAFTLLEVLLAITFITVVFTAITGLILTTLQVNRKNVHNLQATYLAQEGIEAMRYIRDSNWLQNYSWDEGEDQWGTNFGLQASDELNEFYLLEEGDAYWSLVTVSSRSEDSALVTMENGQEFSRVIHVEFVPDEEDPNIMREDTLRVTAIVSWEGRGDSNEVELSTILTNWQ